MWGRSIIHNVHFKKILITTKYFNVDHNKIFQCPPWVKYFYINYIYKVIESKKKTWLDTCKLIRELKKVRQTMKDIANVKVNKTKESKKKNEMKKGNQIGEKRVRMGNWISITYNNLGVSMHFWVVSMNAKAIVPT